MGYTVIPMMASFYEVFARTLITFTLPIFIGYVGICIINPIVWFSTAALLAFSYRKKINTLISSSDKTISPILSLD